MDFSQDPIIIGGTGGSGTRVVARIVRLAGIFMGENLKKSEDALCFHDFYGHWINPYIQNQITEAQKPQFLSEFKRCIAEHLGPFTHSENPWGFKTPRSIYLLPFYWEQFPNMRFIHVIRDGRDMAYSKNQSQLNKHGTALSIDEPSDNHTPLRSIALWNQINIQTADFGELNLKENYLLVRFEDLCSNPEQTIEKIFKFIRCTKPDSLNKALKGVKPPNTLGRWKQQKNMNDLYELHQAGHQALKKFDYWDEKSFAKLKKTLNSFWYTSKLGQLLRYFSL